MLWSLIDIIIISHAIHAANMRMYAAGHSSRSVARYNLVVAREV